MAQNDKSCYYYQMASKGPNDRSNSNGKDRATRQSRTSLAAFYRERFPPQVSAEFYEAVLMGKNPRLVRVPEDEECHEHCDCGYRVLAEDAYPGQGPTLDHKFLAWARIKERAYGQPAQHVHIEQEIKAEITAITGGVDPKFIGTLNPKALEALRRTMLELDAPPPPPVNLRDDDKAVAETIIDADFVEKPKP